MAQAQPCGQLREILQCAWRWRIAALEAALLFVSLSAFTMACRVGESRELKVFAASSLTDAFRAVGAEYEKAHPGMRIEFHFGGSQLLRTQIEQGAPADVFASADTEEMEALRQGSLARDPALLARNRIVAIACSGCGNVTRPEDLALPGVKVVMAAEAVPAGRYARALVNALSVIEGFRPDYSAGVESNVLSHETSVRAVLSRVVLGEADAGFVYQTDAVAAGDKVRILALPPGVEITADYWIAVLAKAAAREHSGAFVRFVLGERGRKILNEHGFFQ